MKTGALYGQEHPQRQRIMGDAHEAFRALDAADGVVSLDVTPEGLEVDGVLLDLDEARELARRITAGGVRRLELSSALELEELDGLASLMALDFERLRLEDDLTTLLWERNWPHVSWEAFEVPADELESDEEPSGFNSWIPDDPPLEPLTSREWAISDFVITAEEAAELAHEVEVAEADPPTAEVGAVLCQIIALEKNVKHITPVLESLRALVDRCLRTGEFAAAGATAHLLDRFGKDPEALTEEKLRAIQQCQASFVSVEAIEGILPVLEAHEWDSADAAVAFLTQLPADAVPILLDAYFTMHSDDARQIVRRALVSLLERNLELVMDRLATYASPALVEIVRILGEVRSKETVGILKETLRNGTAEVRLATIDALAVTGGAHARSVLSRALSDEDAEVRCRARACHGRHGGRGGAGAAPPGDAARRVPEARPGGADGLLPGARLDERARGAPLPEASPAATWMGVSGAPRRRASLRRRGPHGHDPPRSARAARGADPLRRAGPARALRVSGRGRVVMEDKTDISSLPINLQISLNVLRVHEPGNDAAQRTLTRLLETIHSAFLEDGECVLVKSGDQLFVNSCAYGRFTR